MCWCTPSLRTPFCGKPNCHAPGQQPTTTPSKFTPDPAYDLVPDTAVKKGAQCGRCGMKFDHNKAYGYVCGSPGCPMGMGGVTC